MTAKEAIETLRANYPDACYEQLREAVDAAIEALKARDTARDTISRQAAIDALEKVAELFPWRVPGNRDTYDRYNEAWNDAIGRAEIEIEELPSAQPELIEKAAYIRGFEQGRTQGMIDSQGGKK